MMILDDPAVSEVFHRSRVARIATVSRNGRPSVNRLYFEAVDGHIWLGTADWTLAARNVRADDRVSVVLEPESGGADVVRIRGRAQVRTDRVLRRRYERRAAVRFVLTPSGIDNLVSHARQLGLRRRYYAQGAEKGGPCVIDVIPDSVDVGADTGR